MKSRPIVEAGAMSEESLFYEALEKAASERAAFLAAATAGQPRLRAAVEALLHANDAEDNLLDQPPVPSALVDPDPHSVTVTGIVEGARAPGVSIANRYELLQKIGEGGMGEVWVAKQLEPIKRKVALKLIKKGMDSKAVLARFEHERHALALMDHPNIARVHDGGITPEGQSFFVMELVDGLPLNRFCDEAKLTPRERLELFVPICKAVQHAHQKGIVHRDLKPANILITVIDGKGVPKIIDFGVAKATFGRLTDESQFTQFGSVVGTLEYMAPEQAGFAGVDIDTRADIYSLGVILYELLTGLKPIDAKRLKSTALLEMIRVIKEEEPDKPSTRFSTDASMRTLAALRQTDPTRLMAMLRGELDWVVMKCLEKRRDRRYETASGLARDIQRYLAHEPVEARPPSAAYRFSKFLQRNKGPVIATGLVVAALLAGIVGTTLGLIEAKKQEGIARSEAAAKEAARAAEALRAEGEYRAKLEARAEAAAKEEARAAAAALAESEHLATIAAQKAVHLAGKRLEQVNAARQKADEAHQVSEKIRDFFQHGVLGRESFTANGTDERLLPGGIQIEMTENPTVREALVRAAARLAPDKIETTFPKQPLLQSEFLWSIGETYVELGEHELGISFLERAYKLQLQTVGPDSHITTHTMNLLASAYQRAGRIAEAIPVMEQAYKSRLKVYGVDDTGVLTFQSNLGLTYIHAGRTAEGLRILENALEIRTRKFGADEPETLLLLENLAIVYLEAGRYPESIGAFERLRAARVKILGDDHPATLQTQLLLASAYVLAGKKDQALSAFSEQLAKARKTFPKDSPELAKQLAVAGHFLLMAKAFSEAEPLLRESVAIREKQQPEDWSTFNAKALLGAALLGQQKFADAEPLLLAGVKGMQAREKSMPAQALPRLAEGIERLVELYKAQKKDDEAQKWAVESKKYSAKAKNEK